MKCLSLWQPWATLIAIGANSFETRSWATKYRGPILIHAAKRRDVDSLYLCLEEPFRSALKAGGLTKIGDLPFGQILCLSDLTDCAGILPKYLLPTPVLCSCAQPLQGYWCDLPPDRVSPYALSNYSAAKNCPTCGGTGRKPGTPVTLPLPAEPERSFGDYSPGRFAWLLRDTRRFPIPVPCIGHQGLFNVPDELVAEQLAVVGRAA